MQLANFFISWKVSSCFFFLVFYSVVVEILDVESTQQMENDLAFIDIFLTPRAPHARQTQHCTSHTQYTSQQYIARHTGQHTTTPRAYSTTPPYIFLRATARATRTTHHNAYHTHHHATPRHTTHNAHAHTHTRRTTRTARNYTYTTTQNMHAWTHTSHHAHNTHNNNAHYYFPPKLWKTDRSHDHVNNKQKQNSKQVLSSSDTLQQECDVPCSCFAGADPFHFKWHELAQEQLPNNLVHVASTSNREWATAQALWSTGQSKDLRTES